MIFFKETKFFIYFIAALTVMSIYPQTVKIPRIMHSLWLGKEFPARFHMKRLDWVKKHPQWTHILWVDDARNYIYSEKNVTADMNDIINGNCIGKLLVLDIKLLGLENYKIYRDSSYAQKSDIARYQIITTFGGAYVNVDCDCVKPLDKMHSLFECYVGESFINRQQFFSNSLFGAVPGHPVIKECLKNSLNGVKGLAIGSLPLDSNFIRQSIEGERLSALSSFYFFPISPDSKELDEQDKKKLIQPQTMSLCDWQERFHDHSSEDNKHVIGLHIGAEGLFSELKGTMNHLFYCRRYNKTPVVYWDQTSCYYQSEGYNNSHNVWEYYFEPVSNAKYQEGDYVWHLYGAPDNTGIQVEAESNRSRSFRRMVKDNIIDRYVTVKPNIQKKVNDFYDAHMKDRKTVGIHIRHTDRINDPMKVPFDKIIEQANKYADGNTQFLIATDEEQFLDKARKLLNGRVISYQSYRSKDGSPIHLSKNHNYNRALLGEEALIEVLILSRCDTFLHTISNFSYATLLFNPDLDNVLLSNDGVQKKQDESENASKYVIRSWHAGFFSNFCAVMNHLEICEQNNLTPVVYWHKESRYFIPEGFNGSRNAWEYYFEPVSALKHIPGDQIHWDFFTGSTLFGEKSIYNVREKAHRLIKKYIKVNAIVQKKVDDFYNTYLAGKKVIGIHYRGTDKCEEVKQVPFETYIEEINKYADYQIFVASDDQKFIATIKQLYKERVVAYNCCRSSDGKPIHRYKPENAQSMAQLGEDVLVEALLLSRCELLIHSLSNVSTVALYFNPVIEHLLLKAE
jgi:hypothetical protein